MSPNRDSSGVATAPASKEAVNTQVTSVTDTWKAVMSRGRSGITRVCCTDTTIPATASASRVSPVGAGRAPRSTVPGAVLTALPVMGVPSRYVIPRYDITYLS
jgi:hypothetical protein